MNKVDCLKRAVDNWLLNDPKYLILNEKSIQHPIKKELMTFNIRFSDNERSIGYTITGYENEAGNCGIMVEALLYTGLREDVEASETLDRYKLDIKNIGLSGEAILKLSRVYKEEVEFKPEEILEIITNQGISRLIY